MASRRLKDLELPHDSLHQAEYSEENEEDEIDIDIEHEGSMEMPADL